MAIATALTVLAGFAPTYYLRSTSPRPPLAPLLHLHGLLFTTWIAFFLLQVGLVGMRRTDVHRRIGIAGGVLALAMVIVGYHTAIGAARRDFTSTGSRAPLAFLATPLVDLVLFLSLVVLGLLLRRRPETHRRLMLLATIALMPPAFARLPYIGPLDAPGVFGATDLFVLACVLYDWISRKRVHPAFGWGGGATIVLQVFRVCIGGTEVWLKFAKWLIEL